MSELKKSDIRNWLEEKQEFYQGLFIDGEEKNNDGKMAEADEKNQIVQEMLELLDRL